MPVNPKNRIIELNNGNFSVQEIRNSDYGPDWFDILTNVPLHMAEVRFNQSLAERKSAEGLLFRKIIKEG